MKTIATSAVLAVAFTGMFAGAARAQERVVVTVPFSFVVHGEELPAGHYDITSDEGVLSIRGTDNSTRMFALTRPADGRDPAGEEPALVFVRYENENLLSEVWGDETEGRALPESVIVPRRDDPAAHPQPSIVLTSRGEVIEK